MTSTRSTTLTTTMGVIDWVHGHTANGWSDAQPAFTASLTDSCVEVVGIAYLTNGRETFLANASHLTAWQS